MGEQFYSGCWGKQCFMRGDFLHPITRAWQTRIHHSTRQRPVKVAKGWLMKLQFTSDILERLMQAYSGETMAHEERVRSHLARMEHSPAHVPDRRVRPRTGDSPPIRSTAAASSPPGESRDTTTAMGEGTTTWGSGQEEAAGNEETTVPTFPWLKRSLH